MAGIAIAQACSRTASCSSTAKRSCIDKPAGLPVDAPQARRRRPSRPGWMSFAAASSARRRSCTGSTGTRRAACCSRATPRRRAALPALVRSARGPEILSRCGRPRDRRGERRDRPGAGQAVERRGRLADGRRPARPAAVTRWRRLAVREGPTLVEFRPVTGRTHQIRVHAREASAAGSSATGSTARRAAPMLLHASRLVVPRDPQAGDRRHRAVARDVREWADEA